MTHDPFHRPVPLRALAISVAALLVPVLGALRFPEELGEYGAFLWLLMLVPAFLLAYHKGWRGAATALAVGMATLSVTQAVALWVQVPIPDILVGVVAAYIGTVLGVGWMAEGLHRQRAVVEDMAFTDLLTRLPNRRQVRFFLENEFGAAERGRTLSVIIFDLDHFKEYNDTHGHPAGDDALRSFAEILANTTRRADLSARFGGEEFLSVLTGTDAEGAIIFADRIRSALVAARLERGALSVSAGAAAYHPGMRSPDELLAAADHALYQAKREGRNCVRLYTPVLMDHALPSADAALGLPDVVPPEPRDYPRPTEELGRTNPPLTLLPHQITGFGQGRRVLVVEDDDQVRSLLTSYLAREGFVVSEADDVPGGRGQLHDEFDVLVTDLRLPGEPGTELVSAVKSRWPLTQVVVITGIQDPQVAAEALRAGADGYLFKPFGMPDLRTELVAALGRRDSLGAARSGRNARVEPGSQEGRAREAVLHGVRLFVEAAETRFPSTVGHAQRVAAVAHRLALALDAHGERLDPQALRLACEVKDVGNVSLSLDLLELDRPVTESERQQLEGHARVGRHLLDALLDDDTVREVASWHHERWDGGGYPDHLAGEGIPFAARVAAVADALSAMTAPRPHRPALPWADALRELQAKSGGQFDPEVVRAAVGCAEDLDLILRRDTVTGKDAP